MNYKELYELLTLAHEIAKEANHEYRNELYNAAQSAWTLAKIENREIYEEDQNWTEFDTFEVRLQFYSWIKRCDMQTRLLAWQMIKNAVRGEGIPF